MTIAVVGATGFLGEPVARRLKTDGHHVRIVSRDIVKAKQKFGADFDFVSADLAENRNLENAFANCDAVHLNLNSHSFDEAEQLEWHGVEHAIHTAKKTRVKRIGLISGDFEPNLNSPSPRRRAKIRGMNALKNSGLEYMIFACTWFMDSLKDFVLENEALMFGEQPLDWHWIYSGDYAKMVSNGYSNPQAANKYFTIHGIQGLKMLTALKIYCSYRHPGLPVRAVSLSEVDEIAKQPGMEWLPGIAKFMTTFETDGEFGDPNEAYELLGRPQITVEAFSQSLARR